MTTDGCASKCATMVPGFRRRRAAEGHGLALLESRLAMSFGDRARLAVDGRPGDTSVTIELPA